MSSETITLSAAAKLNLRLSVVGVRDDGWHYLDGETVRVDLCDTVVLTRRDDGRLVRAWADAMVTDDDDLTVKAAAALRAVSGTTQGADIAVKKKIPIGAGLGGASSDAAAVLLGLNRLWRTGLSAVQLQTIALTIGADVPFFVSGYAAARVGGVGEKLEATAAAKNFYLLSVPDVCANTAAVYARYRECGKQVSPPPFVSGQNDLTAAAVSLYPDILRAAQGLAEVAGEVCLSGSGAGVFAVFDNEAAAQTAARKLKSTGEKIYVVGISKSADSLRVV